VITGEVIRAGVGDTAPPVRLRLASAHPGAPRHHGGMVPFRQVPALLLLAGFAVAMAPALMAAAADGLDDATRAKLNDALDHLRAESEPVLKEGPIDQIVELGPQAVTAALPDLMPLLSSDDAGLRKEVVKALYPPVVLNAQQLQVLHRLVADPDDDVRAAVNATINAVQAQTEQAKTDQDIRETKELSPRQLLDALQSPTLQARESAEKVASSRLLDADFCREIAGQPAEVTKLVGNADAEVRALALTFLGKCWKDLPPESVPAVTNAASDTDEGAAFAALAALAHAPHHGAGSAAALKAVRYESGVRTGATLGQALATLGELGAWDDELAKVCLAALDDTGAQPGACALITHQGVRLPALAPRLTALVSDRSADVETRAAAMDALAVAGDPKDSAPLFAAILANTGEPRRPRQAASIALQNLGADARSVLPTIEKVAETEEDVDIRLAAKSAAQLIKSH